MKILPAFWIRGLLILAMTGCVKLFFSCDPPPPMDMHYNMLVLEGVDNSGQFTHRACPDTMYSDAVAMQLTLADSSYFFDGNPFCSRSDFSFSSAFALSFPQTFIPVAKVERIRVYTLCDLNDTYKEGDEISDSVYYQRRHSNWELYVREKEVRDYLNSEQSNYFSEIMLFVKPSVKNITAQFRVFVYLDNGEILSDSTQRFTIIPSP
ncbi:MAG TPA: DUF5034 domain-containing protein [Prolixibacteraceae bacterium]|nr:DUF5034 domain-containing protein [Prolixibacteraceae bacterium]